MGNVWPRTIRRGGRAIVGAEPKQLERGSRIYCKYRDHVMFHRVNPNLVGPQIRETVGWLVYECPEYILLSWDRDAGPPTLKGGGKADGLLILRPNILELRRLP